MKFTIDLKKTIGIFNQEHYRWKQDKTWRLVEGKDEIKESDKVFTSLEEVNSLTRGSNIKIKLNGKEIIANRGLVSLKEPTWRLKPAIHRIRKPQIPSREEFIQTMTSANVDHLNVLVIDLNGHFKMLTPHENEEHLKQFSGNYMAVRHESFSAGTGYVGPEILNDKKFLEDVYLNMLHGWYLHLQTNRFQIYVDNHMQFEEEEIIEKINEVTKHLISV